MGSKLDDAANCLSYYLNCCRQQQVEPTRREAWLYAIDRRISQQAFSRTWNRYRRAGWIIPVAAPCTSKENEMEFKPLDYDALPEWTYEPSGDGDPDYDWMVGVQHFVMEGNEKIARPPDESRARLMAASPAMYRALLAVKRQFFAIVTEEVWFASGQAPNLLKQVDAAIEAARPRR